MQRKLTVPRVCQRCGKGFFTHTYAARIGKALYCGRACAHPRVMPEEHVCLTCGKTFPSKPFASRQATGRGKYCSKACYWVSVETHGDGSPARRAPEYTIWCQMKSRCMIPSNCNYPNYGARGIRVCDRWRDSYEAFLADMGRRPSADHSIERIDNDGPYSPDNCRWATRAEQGRNRRTSRLLTFRGGTRCAADWADIAGITPACLYQRLRHGWTLERALTAPLQPNMPRT